MAPTRRPEKLEPYTVYTDREITAYFGVSKKFFARLRKSGVGPEYFHVGRGVRYFGRDVWIWARMNARSSTVSHLEPKQKQRQPKIFVGYARRIDAGILAAMWTAGQA